MNAEESSRCSCCFGQPNVRSQWNRPSIVQRVRSRRRIPRTRRFPDGPSRFGSSLAGQPIGMRRFGSKPKNNCNVAKTHCNPPLMTRRVAEWAPRLPRRKSNSRHSRIALRDRSGASTVGSLAMAIGWLFAPVSRTAFEDLLCAHEQRLTRLLRCREKLLALNPSSTVTKLLEQNSRMIIDCESGIEALTRKITASDLTASR